MTTEAPVMEESIVDLAPRRFRELDEQEREIRESGDTSEDSGRRLSSIRATRELVQFRLDCHHEDVATEAERARVQAVHDEVEGLVKEVHATARKHPTAVNRMKVAFDAFIEAADEALDIPQRVGLGSQAIIAIAEDGGIEFDQAVLPAGLESTRLDQIAARVEKLDTVRHRGVSGNLPEKDVPRPAWLGGETEADAGHVEYPERRKVIDRYIEFARGEVDST
jgi:hypothetical protein